MFLSYGGHSCVPAPINRHEPLKKRKKRYELDRALRFSSWFRRFVVVDSWAGAVLSGVVLSADVAFTLLLAAAGRHSLAAAALLWPCLPSHDLGRDHYRKLYYLKNTVMFCGHAFCLNLSCKTG